MVKRNGHEGERPPAGSFARGFFVLFALAGAASVASRYEFVLERTPEWAALAVLFAHGPLLFVAGLLDLRMREDADGDLPAWMTIKDRSVRYAFTLSFTYLSIAALQLFDIEIGPIDPTPPPSFPPLQRALWFGMFSFGMGFANYLAAVRSVVPVLRFAARPLQHLSLLFSVPIAAAVGAGVASCVLFAASL